MKAEKVYDQTFTARNFNTSPLTISGLEGDLYDYELVMWAFNGSTSIQTYIYPNADSSTTTKREYRMVGAGASASASTSDNNQYIKLTRGGNNTPDFVICTITGSSGDERYFDILSAKGGGTKEVSKNSNYWKNTADELTSLEIGSIENASTDAHIILYRTPKEASQEKWELVETQSVTTQNINTTPIDFTGLSGDTDLQYKLVIQGEWISGSGSLSFRLNSDSGTNYTKQRLSNSGGTIQSQNLNEAYGGILRNNDNTQCNAYLIINAESGVKRLCVASGSKTGGINEDQNESATWWSNTVDEVNTISILQPSGTPSWTGTAKLYRRKNPNTIGDTLPFEMVEEVAVSGDFSAGHTFSGLSGDDVLLYKLELLGEGDAVDTTTLQVQFNSDTGSNYTDQRLVGFGSSTLAAASTSTALTMGYLDNEGSLVTYLYPKSGENRPLLSDCRASLGSDQVNFFANWWNNSSDEITDIKVFGNNTRSLTGTLKLSRLTI